MFFPESQVTIWLYAKATDMRKSFDGLSALVKNHLHENPLGGHLFVFISRRQTQVKILYFDRSGYCLWSKRLEKGCFNYNKPQSFGLVTFDTTTTDPQVTYDVINIDGEKPHSITVRRSELTTK